MLTVAELTMTALMMAAPMAIWALHIVSPPAPKDGARFELEGRE